MSGRGEGEEGLGKEDITSREGGGCRKAHVEVACTVVTIGVTGAESVVDCFRWMVTFYAGRIRRMASRRPRLVAPFIDFSYVSSDEVSSTVCTARRRTFYSN